MRVAVTKRQLQIDDTGENGVITSQGRGDPVIHQRVDFNERAMA